MRIFIDFSKNSEKQSLKRQNNLREKSAGFLTKETASKSKFEYMNLKK